MDFRSFLLVLPCRPRCGEADSRVRCVGNSPSQIWHARTAFRDWPDPTRRRHLLRLWLSLPDGIELPPVFAERYGNIERWTVRGGIRVPGAELACPLEAE